MLSVACMNSLIHFPSAKLKSHTTKPAQNKVAATDSSQTNIGMQIAIFIKTIETGKIGILYILLAKALTQKQINFELLLYKTIICVGYREKVQTKLKQDIRAWKFD